MVFVRPAHQFWIWSEYCHNLFMLQWLDRKENWEQTFFCFKFFFSCYAWLRTVSLFWDDFVRYSEQMKRFICILCLCTQKCTRSFIEIKIFCPPQYLGFCSCRVLLYVYMLSYFCILNRLSRAWASCSNISILAFMQGSIMPQQRWGLFHFFKVHLNTTDTSPFKTSEIRRKKLDHRSRCVGFLTLL